MATIVLIVIYVALLAIASIASYRFAPPNLQTGIETFVKVLTVAVAAVSALMAAVVTIINFDRNTKLSKQLITDKLAADKELERWKALHFDENKAYQDLLNAVMNTYYTLAKLESAKWESKDKASIDAAMSHVSGRTALLQDRTNEILWQKIWQRANYIAECAEALKKTREQPDLWRREAEQFSALVQSFNQIVAEKRHQV